MLLKFIVGFKSEGRGIRLLVEQIHIDKNMEQYRVYGRNGSVVFQSNRPRLRNLGLKKKPPHWNLVEGTMNNMHARECIIDAIMKKVDAHYQAKT